MYRTLTLAIFFNISVTSSMRPCDSNQRIDSGKKLKNSQDRRVIITVKYFMQAKAVVIKLWRCRWFTRIQNVKKVDDER